MSLKVDYNILENSNNLSRPEDMPLHQVGLDFWLTYPIERKFAQILLDLERRQPPVDLHLSDLVVLEIVPSMMK
jgi:hypothetical protein